MVKRDLDVETMTLVQAKDEIMKLRNVLRPIATAQGHGLCHWWPEVRKALPELQGQPDPVPPPTCEFLLQCAVFRATLGPVGELYAMTWPRRDGSTGFAVGTADLMRRLRKICTSPAVMVVRLRDQRSTDPATMRPLRLMRAGMPDEPLSDLQQPSDVQELPRTP